VASQLRGRGDLMAAENVQVTVTKQFAEPFTCIDDGDEIRIVPASPTPPATERPEACSNLSFFRTIVRIS
jgi:hypothetical protein